MIPNNLIQAALITKFKAAPTITNLLKNAGAVKEDQWQGTVFVYPAVRVQLGMQVPLQSCSSTVPLTIICKDENASSKKADALAGAVTQLLHEASWCDIIQGVRFIFIRATGLVSAVREDALTWRAEANFQVAVELSSKAP